MRSVNVDGVLAHEAGPPTASRYAPHFTDAAVERARAAIAVAFGVSSDLASQHVAAHEALRAVFPHATFEHADTECRHPDSPPAETP